MIEVEVHIPAHSWVASIPRLVEEICVEEGLTCTLRGTLARYPGCLHWHFKKGSQRGTLEITWWDKENRPWFKVASGRTGAWIEKTIVQLKNRIERFMNDVAI